MRSSRACLGACLFFLANPTAAQTHAGLPPPRELGRDLPAYGAPDPNQSGTGASLPTDPTGELFLREALAAALLGNPELASSAWEVRAREAQILQAGLRPNPELELEIEDVGGSDELRGAREAQATLLLSQLVELGDKRAARIRAAELGSDLAAWDYEAKRLDVFTATAQAFADVLVAQERIRLTEETLNLAGDVTETARDRLRAGLAPAVEVTRGEVATSSAEVERLHAHRELDTARQRLASQWGGLEARFARAVGSLEDVVAPPPLESLLGRASDNPDLARWDAETAEREAILRVERSRAVPDVRVGPGVRRLAGPDETVFVLGASIPLPIFGRNQGAVAEASHRLVQAREERRGAQVRVVTELIAAHRALAASFAEVEVLRKTTLPAAESSFRGVRDGYLRGRFGYLDVLDAQRTRFATQAQYLRALGAFHRNAASVERLIAAPLRQAP